MLITIEGIGQTGGIEDVNPAILAERLAELGGDARCSSPACSPCSHEGVLAEAGFALDRLDGFHGAVDRLPSVIYRLPHQDGAVVIVAARRSGRVRAWGGA